MVTLVVEDGTGLLDANSYTSVSTADSFIEVNIHDTTWVSASDETKSKLLIWATQLIDRSVNFKGTKRYQAAALRWPRTGVSDVDGYAIAEDEIPLALQQAVAEMARLLLTTDRTAESETKGLKELKVDVIGLVFDKTDRVGVFPPTVSALLNQLGTRTIGGRSRKVVAA